MTDDKRGSTMNMEEQLAEEMRRTAGTMEPRVTDLVDGGVARGRRRRLRNRVGAASAVAAVTAAAVTAGVATLGAGASDPTRPPAMQMVSATEVLNKAAQSVEVRPKAMPRPDQWVYEKTLESGIGAEHGKRPVTGEHWFRWDGARDAGFQGGKLVVYRNTGPRSKYGRIGTLPAGSKAMRAKFYADVNATNRKDWTHPDRDGEVFGTVAQLLWDTPVGIAPKTQADLYRVIATIPGVRVDRKVKDGAGRPAVAVSHGFGEQYLLDPTTYLMVGQRTVSNGHNAPKSITKGVDPAFKVPNGIVTYSLTRLTAKVVDKAGQR
ncbi:CU044_5270 family protein [Spirillospora sp. NBC_01491]|uniref:CU044_5270 family protein n=1 Tax=Spirillospora sp. NBC_01491 TaxID=2976007 RepID=UPI002E380817|nr:CU044_5270 family protein [Spirillospora sp. NBC_01491]